jgi:hypothetical protein
MKFLKRLTVDGKDSSATVCLEQYVAAPANSTSY